MILLHMYFSSVNKQLRREVQNKIADDIRFARELAIEAPLLKKIDAGPCRCGDLMDEVWIFDCR